MKKELPNVTVVAIACNKQAETIAAHKSTSLEDIDGEVWKDVVGYEGLYKVSNKGRVKSVKRTTPQQKSLDEKILSAHLDKDGYPQIALCKEGKIVTRKIHRVELIAFVPNVFNKPCINHKDGVKWNNELENLEWCTISENTKHSYEIGLQVPNTPSGAKNPKSDIVNQYDSNNNLINSFIGVREAERQTGYDRCTIMYSHQNKKVNKYGHKWQIVKRNNYLM